VLETLPLTAQQQRDRLGELLAQMKLETVLRYNGSVHIIGWRAAAIGNRAITRAGAPRLSSWTSRFLAIDPLTVVTFKKLSVKLRP